MSAKIATNLQRSRIGRTWSSPRSKSRAPNSRRESSRLENRSGPNDERSVLTTPFFWDRRVSLTIVGLLLKRGETRRPRRRRPNVTGSSNTVFGKENGQSPPDRTQSHGPRVDHHVIVLRPGLARQSEPDTGALRVVSRR